MGNEIQDQVRLPLGVAVGVVMQGIRIRFGRSVVTILGVVFGIAFLMSILTAQIIREGVSEEEALRTEVRRMMSFLSAETGLPEHQIYGVLACGPLSDTEARLLHRLRQENAQRFRWAGAVAPPQGLLAAMVQRVHADETAHQAQAVLVMGDGPLPDIDWPEKTPALVFTRNDAMPAQPPGPLIVSLQRELKPEEIARAKEEARRRRSRNIWIVTASLLVTVIGISNAMLMSVTERFREIGTMKCLGALSAFIRRIFLIESGFMGFIGASAGALAGALFSVLMYSVPYGLPAVLGALELDRLLLYLAASVLSGIVLSMLAAIYPASVAARMVPSDALRTTV